MRLLGIRKRFLSPWALVCAVLCVAFVVPLFLHSDPFAQHRQILLDSFGLPVPPATVSGYPFGGDTLGRDLFAGIFLAIRHSLIVALCSALLATMLGVVLGGIAGFFGGVVDGIVQWLVDYSLALPSLILLMAIRASFDEVGLMTMVAMLALFGWTTIARVTRTKVLSVKSLDYVQYAKILGKSRFQILFREVLPNTLAPAAILGGVLVARMVIFESALSYLGMGQTDSHLSLGGYIREAGTIYVHRPHVLLIPGFAIVFVVIAFNWLSETWRTLGGPDE